MDLETRSERGIGPDAELWLPFPLGRKQEVQEGGEGIVAVTVAGVNGMGRSACGEWRMQETQ